MALYRLVPAGPLGQDGFRTTREEGVMPEADECGRCAISTYAERRHIEGLRDRVPHFHSHELAFGTVPKEAGRLKNVPSRRYGASHWHWWPLADAPRHVYFHKVP
jgi:hypothetical protein